MQGDLEMKKYAAVLCGAAVLSVLAFSMGSLAVGDSPNVAGDLALLSMASADASGGTGMTMAAATDMTATADGTEEKVYFFPYDSDTVTTLVFLTNTGTTPVQVSGTAWYADGTMHSSGGFDLAPHEMKTVASNEAYVYNGVAWNLFNATSACLVLPAGVVIDGFVASNGDEIYHPDVPCLKVPLRFTHISEQ